MQNNVILNSIKKNKKSILDEYSNGYKINKKVIPIKEKMYKEDSGFAIYLCKDAESLTEDSYYKFTIKGKFISNLIVGQTYEVYGEISSYKNELFDEKQIFVQKITPIKPINEKGIIEYLKSLKGLKNKANLIYDKYGDKSVDILMNNPMDIAKNIKGIGEKTAINCSKQLEQLKDSQYTISSLLSYGLTVNSAKKLYNEYQDEILIMIENNPYLLAKEVKGYSFKTCDKIARNIGYDLKSKFRIREAIIYTLEEAESKGHCFLPLSKLIEYAKELLAYKLTIQEMENFLKSEDDSFIYEINNKLYLIVREDIQEVYESYINEKNLVKREQYKYIVDKVEENEIIAQFDNLIVNKRIIIVKDEVQEDKIYLSYLYENENIVAKIVKEIKGGKKFNNNLNINKVLDNYCKDNNIYLEEKQREVVLKFSSEEGGINIITGPAGSGKTFILKILIKMLEKQYKACNSELGEIKIFAPTGKASKVASKATGYKCSTIHKGLGYSQNGIYKYNKDNPIKSKVVVIDESTMVDIILMRHLLEAIKKGTKLILLGDINQIPSIGAGNVFKDLIESKCINTVALNVVKRQGILSGINKNANKILNKEIISSCLDTEDAYIISKEYVEEIQETIVRCIERSIQKFNYSIEDIQVLCQQKSSKIGTIMLNYIIQKNFNPLNEENVVRNKVLEVKDKNNNTIKLELNFKKNDKVINTKNDYNMKWYIKRGCGIYEVDNNNYGITNGETGIIEDIVEVKNQSNNIVKRIIVKYEDGYVFYENEYSYLDHAYALTIHKSQGSQWPVVILPMATQNYIMLDNNLFYTAYTRARKMILTIGQNKAIYIATNSTKIITRYTNLKELLRK